MTFLPKNGPGCFYIFYINRFSFNFVNFFRNEMLICKFRMTPAGDPPSPRAAHAAAAVGTMVVFQVI